MIRPFRYGRRPVARSLSLVTLVLVGLMGCTSQNGIGLVPPGAAQDAVVTVKRSNIRSVVALPATVVASPQVTFFSREAGRDFEPRKRAGDVARVGDVLAEYVKSDGTKGRVRTSAEVEITDVELAPGSSFPTSLPLFSAKLNALAVQADVQGAYLYRLQNLTGTGRAQIENGPGPFDCRVVGQYSKVGEGFTLVCAPVEPLTLAPGLPAVLAVDAGTRRQVASLPLSAVAGQAERGLVTLRSGEKREEVEVRLGLSDGVSVEIVSGLKVGDVVSAVPPDLTYAKPGG